jgi:hypothetical protein
MGCRRLGIPLQGKIDHRYSLLEILSMLVFDNKRLDGTIAVYHCNTCASDHYNYMFKEEPVDMRLVCFTIQGLAVLVIKELSEEDYDHFFHYHDAIGHEVEKLTGLEGIIPCIYYRGFGLPSYHDKGSPCCWQCGAPLEKKETNIHYFQYLERGGAFYVLDNHEKVYKHLVADILQRFASGTGMHSARDLPGTGAAEEERTNSFYHCVQNGYIKQVSTHHLDYDIFYITEAGKQKLAELRGWNTRT